MFWSRLGLIGLTVLWLAASTARAQTDLPLDPIAPDQTKPIETGLFLEIPSVYGAAKYDQKVNEAPAAVIIITAEQIRKYGYRDFAQILDSAPGLFTPVPPRKVVYSLNLKTADHMRLDIPQSIIEGAQSVFR